MLWTALACLSGRGARLARSLTVEMNPAVWRPADKPVRRWPGCTCSHGSGTGTYLYSQAICQIISKMFRRLIEPRMRLVYVQRQLQRPDRLCEIEVPTLLTVPQDLPRG